MNYKKACQILELDPTKISPNQIKKQYHYFALKYHPDKTTAPESAVRFLEIKEAYDYLMNDIGTVEEDDNHEFEDCPDDAEKIRFYKECMSFVGTLYNNDFFQRQIFHPLMKRILSYSEQKSLVYIQTLTTKQLSVILQILNKYSDVFYLSSKFILQIEKEIASREKNEENSLSPPEYYIILKPTLKEMKDGIVYRLEEAEQTYHVPLWHSILFYEPNLIVKCVPDINDNNLSIDIYNNIHISRNYSAVELLEMESPLHIVEEGCFDFTIPVADLHMKKYQIITFAGQGIPIANENAPLDVSKISNVYLHIRIQ